MCGKHAMLGFVSILVHAAESSFRFRKVNSLLPLGRAKERHALLLAALPIWRRVHADIDAEQPAIDIPQLRMSLASLA